MGAPRVTFTYLTRCIQSAMRKGRRDMNRIDQLLDMWYDQAHRATEYDATLWGFPARWMRAEREYMRDTTMVKVGGRWYGIHR